MNLLLALISLLFTLTLALACGGKSDLPTSPTATTGSCDLAIDPASQTAPQSGGSYYTAVTGPCAWTAATDDNWISITYGQGVTVGSVTYTVAPNPSSTTREGRVRIGEEVLTVRQLGPGCSFSVQPASQSVPAEGGTFELRIATDSQCPWSALRSEPWLVLHTSSGTGSRTISFTASENTSTTERNATIQIADQTLSIHQAAKSGAPVPPPGPPAPPAPPAPGCTYALNPSSQNVGGDGGSFQAGVTAPAGCSWTAIASETWILLSTRTGSGGGSLSYTVAVNSGPARTATIRVGDQTLSIHQSASSGSPPPPTPPGPSCTYTLNSTSQNVGADGGSFQASVTTSARCPGSAATSESWIALSPNSGLGSGSLAYAVQPNAGGERTGTIRVADQTLSIRQVAPAVSQPVCKPALSPTSESVDVGGGSFKANVTVSAGCPWSATTSEGWISITAGSGSGSGSLAYTVQSNSASERTGTIRVADQTLSIRQSGREVAPPITCAPPTLNPTSQNVASNGGDFTIAVTVGATCKWSASSSDSWISIRSGSGAGNGQIAYSVSPNTGPSPRSGRIDVDGRSVTISQEGAPPPPPCPAAVDPSSLRVPASGGDFAFSVKAADDCRWSASSTSWIDIRSGSGAGSGRGTYSVGRNDGPERSGEIRIGERSITVAQDAGERRVECSLSLSPTAQDVSIEGGVFSIKVSVNAGCAWKVEKAPSWIKFKLGSGNGPGEVIYIVDRADGAARSDAIVVNGQSVTVSQAGLK